MDLRCTARHRSLLLGLALSAEILGCAAGLHGQTDMPPGLLGILEGHRKPVYALAVAHNGFLATGAQDRSVALWNITGPTYNGVLTPRKPARRLEGHLAGVTALAFARIGPANISSSGEVLISGGADNTTRIWNFRTGEILSVVNHPKTVFGVAVRPEALPANPRSTSLRDGIQTSREVGIGGGAGAGGGETPHELDHVQAEVGAGTDGEFATACWDGVIRIFGLSSGVQRAALSGHSGGLYAVAYSPLDGSLLASASADRTVRIWDLHRMELLWTLRGFKDHVTAIDWSPLEPFTLASGGWDRQFRLWEVKSDEVEACRSSKRCSTSLVPRTAARHPQLVWKVAFAPGGELVAACHGAVGQSPTVIIYDAATGRISRRLGRHKDTPLVVAWSPDGSILVSAGMDRKVLLYDALSTFDDLPQGDLDDIDEQAQWRDDLAEYRMGRSPRSSANLNGSNASNLSQNITTNVTDGTEPGLWLPHPVAGRAAFF